jgi:multidrug efflux pump subunit AcrB
VIAVHGSHPVQIKDVARVERGPEPVFQAVTAQGRNAVLLNIQSQADGSTLDIANALKKTLQQLRQELPLDMHLVFFYDQSLFVRDSVRSVWDAIIFGLILSVLILYFFLKNWRSVWTAILTIPITVLITLLAMKLANMSLNMMTLGGIAASIGLVIDDAIVVVEAMCAKIALSGITGVFFRALALTMVVSLLTSLILALTLTPSLAAWFISEREKTEKGHTPGGLEAGLLLKRVIRIY